MEELKFLEPLFKNPVFQFFLLMALVQLLAQVFLDRRVAFWVSSIGTTFIWMKNFDVSTPLKAWVFIFLVLFLISIPKILFNFNLFLYIKGKKRCPRCYSEVHRKAHACAFCGYEFSNAEEEPKE